MPIRELTTAEKKFKEDILNIRVLNIPKNAFVRDKNFVIQQMFCEFYCKNIDQSELLTGSSMNQGALNDLIRKIRQSGNFNAIFNYTQGGIGPGEVMLYFLVSGSELGGQLSRGDLKVDGEVYEVKVPEIGSNGGKKFARDVRIAGGGGTRQMQQVLADLGALARKLNLGGDFQTSSLDIMRQKAKDEFEGIERRFAEGVEDYFKGKKVIILDGGKGSGSTERGNVVKIFDRIDKSLVTLYRHTSNEFKANIQL